MNEFENLKVGDLMVMHASYCGDCLRKVERVTKSQIVVGDVFLFPEEQWSDEDP